MRADGSGQQRLTTVPGYDGGPFFTHDGTRIVWRRFDEQGLIADVFTMKLDGSDVRADHRLRRDELGALRASVGRSTSSSRRTSSASRTSSCSWSTRAGTKEPVRVTYSDGFDGLPVPSPDGRQLAWTSSRSGGSARPAVPRAVESREGARGDQERAAAKAEQEMTTRTDFVARRSLSLCAHRVAPRRCAAQTTAPHRATRPHVTALASRAPRRAARRVDRRAARRRLPRLAAEANRRAAAAGPDRTTGCRSSSPPGRKRRRLAPDRRRQATRSVHAARRSIQALSFSDNGEVSGPVVFAGYGIVVPDSQDFGYDSYATLDVKDKIVLVLRYFPEDADQKTKGILARYSDLRYKAMAARQRGAKALLVVTGPRSPNAGETIPMTFDTALAGSGIVAASISGARRRRDLRAAPARRSRTRSARFDSGNPHVAGFEIPDVTVTVARVGRPREADRLQRRRLSAGRRPDPARRPKPWIALGAHYDHLGRGENGNSLADKRRARAACTTAPTTTRQAAAAVLAIGEMLRQADRGAATCCSQFWSGEELGLIGSAAFVNAPPVPLDQTRRVLQLRHGRPDAGQQADRAGRRARAPAWARLIEQANVAAGFDLRAAGRIRISRPTSRASTRPACRALNFFTGTHADYHRPTRHGRQDRLRRSRSHRRVRGGDRAARRRRRRSRRRSRRSSSRRRAAAAPACASSPARFPTTRPR